MSRLLKFSQSWAWVTPSTSEIRVHRFSTLPLSSRTTTEWTWKARLLNEGIIQSFPYADFYYFERDHSFPRDPLMVCHLLGGENLVGLRIFSEREATIINEEVHPLSDGHVVLPSHLHLLRYDPETLSFTLIPNREGKCYLSRPRGIFTHISTSQ